MRNIVIFAIVLIGLGTFMAQKAEEMSASATPPSSATPAPAAVAPRETALAAVPPPQADNRSFSITPDSRGHFQADGMIDGQRISFMVDTGASVVALNETSADSIGLRPTPGDYRATVTTANGTVKAARARIAMLNVGGLIVRDVDAIVLPDEALSENLLGLSFLKRLKRFEYANGTMVLEQ